jgi:hypothetical protein
MQSGRRDAIQNADTVLPDCFTLRVISDGTAACVIANRRQAWQSGMMHGAGLPRRYAPYNGTFLTAKAQGTQSFKRLFAFGFGTKRVFAMTDMPLLPAMVSDVTATARYEAGSNPAG